MADLARALLKGTNRQRNNNDNIGNTANVRVVNLPQMTEANFLRSQRITESYEKKDAALQRITRRLKECQTIVTKRPKEIQENQFLITSLSQKAKLSNRNQGDLNKLIAENIKLQNDIQGCRLETAGLLDRKKQLETELVFNKKWYNEEQSLAAFNVPKPRSAVRTLRRINSMVGGRKRSTRRK